MLIKASWLVDRRGDLHRHGEIDTGGSTSLLELADMILMPGLFDAHVHLDYTHMAGRIPPPRSFTAWIEQINRIKRTWTDADFTRSILDGLTQTLDHGTTAMINWICHPRIIPSLLLHDQRIWWLWEQISLQPSPLRAKWDDWNEAIAPAAPLWQGGLAPHALYSCHPDVLGEALSWCSLHRRTWSIHLSESTEEQDLFLNRKGPLFEFCGRLGRNMDDTGSRTPLQILLPLIASARSPGLLVHANCLSGADIAALAAFQKRPNAPFLSIAHCPRSARYFQHPPFPLHRLKDSGINLCLGADSPASNTDLSLFQEMAALRAVYPNLEPSFVFRMATLHAAKALGLENEWAQWQDWIAIPSGKLKTKQEVWQAITGFTGKPSFVMVDNRIARKPQDLR
ncbi:MAG: amidohydrolase family protein [Verrucomicrobiae bacterium]|nr:amidohydrolase family protein [Verrucomicrobiae bacterium]